MYKAWGGGSIRPHVLTESAKKAIKHIEDFGNGMGQDEIEELEEESFGDLGRVFEQRGEERELPQYVAVKKTRLRKQHY